jgi:RimJ/RimL family protein N-acetyltransferase
MLNEYLRKTTDSDMELLYQWANDPVVRANAFDSTPISFDVHQKWFKEKLASQNILIFIYHCNNKDIGQVRLDIKDDTATIDYSIDITFRGKGYGYQMMRLFEEKIINEYPRIKCFHAQVKFKNDASASIFRKLNYTEYRRASSLKFIKVLSPCPLPPANKIIWIKFRSMSQEYAA